MHNMAFLTAEQTERRKSTEERIKEKLKQTSKELRDLKMENLEEMKSKELSLRDKLLNQIKLKQLEKSVSFMWPLS